MAGVSIFRITVQSALMSVVSSLVAQVISAYTTESSFVIDWLPVAQFFVFALVSTPPNVMWQTFLESTFPGHVPRKVTGAMAKEEEKNRSSSSKTATAPRIRNTLLKTLLDQSVGAVVMTLLFCTFMGAWECLVVPASSPVAASAPNSASASASASVALAISSRVRRDYWQMLQAGWRFWPMVSLGNFLLVRDLATRNLVGGLAGIVWGVYVSILAAAS